jgi:hypothetical protein
MQTVTFACIEGLKWLYTGNRSVLLTPNAFGTNTGESVFHGTMLYALGLCA